MAFQRVPDSAEVDVIYLYNGEVVQNTFYARFGGTYSQSDLENLAIAVDTAVGNQWLPLQPPEAIYQRTEVRGLNAENDFLASNNDSTGPGTDPIAAFPNQVTFSVKKESAFTGRSARGRTYWIGIPANKVQAADENRLESAYRTSVVAAVEGIRLVLDAAFNWDPVLVSRFTGGLKRSEGVTFPWASTTSVDDIIDTQRNRLPQ